MKMASNPFGPFTFYLLLPGFGVGKDIEACPEAPLLRELNISHGSSVGLGASSQRRQKQQDTALSWKEVPQNAAQNAA